MTKIDDNLNDEINHEVRDDKPNFFSFKGDGKINKKFLKYEDGAIKYFRENKVGLDDVMDDGEQFIKRNIKNKTKKELVFYILIIITLISPVLLYAYYGPSLKNQAPNNPVNISVDNKQTINSKEKDTRINQKEVDQIHQDVAISFEEFLINIQLESNELHNENINKLESFFNKKSNKAGLRSTISKNLKKQEDLYLFLAKGKDVYDKPSEIQAIDTLENLIVDDIYKTTQVLNIIDTNLKRSYIDDIYK